MDSVGSRPLIGRENEMKLLTDAFLEASAGVLRTMLISAEAGGGKTRLIAETTRSFSGGILLQGWCLDQGEPGLPFAPFVSAIRQVLKARGITGLDALIGRDNIRELARLLPALGPAPSEGDPGMGRSRLFEAMRALLDGLSREAPVVLVLEDLHWADRGTRDLLQYLVRNLADARLLLLVSFRTEALGSTRSLRSGLAELSRMERVTTLELQRLTRAQVALHMQSLLGRQPTPGQVAVVHARAQGVPLFTEAMLFPDGSVRENVPNSIRDLLLSPALGLSDRAREVLGAVAIGCLAVHHRLLAAVLGADGLEEAVREAVACDLLRSSGDAGYLFRHALIREAVLEDMLPGERARLHRAYARALDEYPMLADGTWVAAALATHWREAGDPVESMRAAWQASSEAASRFAYASQLAMLEHVLSLWEQVEPGSRPGGVDRAQVLELAADAACWAVEPDRGLRVVEAGLAEPTLAADDERVAALLLQRAMMRQQQLHPGELVDLHAALRLSRPGTRLRAEALGQLCRALSLHGHVERLPRPAEALTMLARQLGEPEWTIEATVSQALAGVWLGDSALLTLRDALRSSQAIGSGRLEMIARVALVDALNIMGENAQAVNEARSAWARTHQLGQARYMGASVASRLARSLFAVGMWDDALKLVAEAFELDPSPLGRAQLYAIAGPLASWRGEVEMAQRSLDALLLAMRKDAEVPGLSAAAAQLTIDLAHLQHDEPGLREACKAVESLRAQLQPSDLWPVLASAWRAVGATRGAESIRQILKETMNSLPARGRHAHALLLICRADEISRPSRLQVKAWLEAVAASESLGSPQYLSYAQMRLGAALLDAGDRGGASEALRRAALGAQDIAAAPLVAEIAALARKARLEIGTCDIASSTPTPMGLTPRELQVLKLVSEGRSNREIAEDLFISIKTASVHVSNILAKLKVSSRGAAGAAARRLGLLDR